MNKPFFSIIVPVYNKQDYIYDCLNSILTQSFEDFELILVLDPCTDGSESIIDQFQDARIRKYHRDSPGPGGYAARNLGIEKSTGQWIKFLDADDVYEPNHLGSVVRQISEVESCELHTCARKIQKEGNINLDKFSQAQKCNNRIFNFREFLKLSKKYEYPFHPNVVTIKSDLAKENMPLFPEGRTNRSGDIYAWIYLACKAGNFSWSDSVGSVLNKDVEGVSSSSCPTPALFRELYFEIAKDIPFGERLLLKSYLNKLIVMASLNYLERQVSLEWLSPSLFWLPNPIVKAVSFIVEALFKNKINSLRLRYQKLKSFL